MQHTAGLAQIVIPSTDLAISAEFYSRCFGVEIAFKAPNVVALSVSGIRLLLTQSEKGKEHANADSMILYFHVKDIEKVYATMLSAGESSLTVPHEIAKIDGKSVWIAIFSDPSGHCIGLYEEK